MFIMLTMMSIVGPGILQVIVVLGILYGITGSRTVRSAVISIKGNVYLEAARAIGAPSSTILFRHVLPNVMAPLIIVFTSRMGAAILAEASISFLGFGTPPPAASWGELLKQAHENDLKWWLALPPGIAIAIVAGALGALAQPKKA